MNCASPTQIFVNGVGLLELIPENNWVNPFHIVVKYSLKETSHIMGVCSLNFLKRETNPIVELVDLVLSLQWQMI